MSKALPRVHERGRTCGQVRLGDKQGSSHTGPPRKFWATAGLILGALGTHGRFLGRGMI